MNVSYENGGTEFKEDSEFNHCYFIYRIFLHNRIFPFQLMLPTGTIVSVDISDMQLSILPSSLDWLRSEGNSLTLTLLLQQDR